MKNTITVFFVLALLRLAAQKTDEGYSPVQYKASCRSSYDKVKLTGDITPAKIEAYLKSTVPNLKDARTGLKLNYTRQSPGGFHYSFTQLFNGVEVYQSEIKVNTDRQHTIHSLFDNSETTSGWKLDITGANAQSVIALRAETGVPVLCQRKVINNVEVLEATGEVIFQRDMNSYFAHDSLVTGKVFRPDPLTTAQVGYGAPYFDDTDKTTLELNNQLQTVSFMARYDGGVFKLENDYISIVDFGAPNYTIATSNNGEFFFNRSQSGFEDVNAFYHLNQIQQHIHSLGFDCADHLVEADPHGWGDQDQSFFSPGIFPPRLTFGDGGVDDAEDADVCVHEYGHFVSEMAAPNSNSGNYRKALDEGFGDYLAGTYSNNLSSYGSNWIFNWDGHNEFWNGRILNTSMDYPTGTTSIYQNGQVWSACLMCLQAAIGRNSADSIILQAHYSYSQNIDLPDGGQLLMDADTILTGGKYACPIYNCLFQHGLHPQNPFINCEVGIKNVEGFPLQFSNQPNSFSIRNPDAKRVQIQLLNLQGQMLKTIDESQPVFNYNDNTLATGIYLVNLKVNGVEKTFKWSKF